jgi:Zn-dependent protease with chaperone function
LEQLEPAEVDAIVAHEIGHLAHNDVLKHSLATYLETILTCFLIDLAFDFGVVRWPAAVHGL